MSESLWSSFPGVSTSTSSIAISDLLAGQASASSVSEQYKHHKNSVKAEHCKSAGPFVDQVGSMSSEAYRQTPRSFVVSNFSRETLGHAPAAGAVSNTSTAATMQPSQFAFTPSDNGTTSPPPFSLRANVNASPPISTTSSSQAPNGQLRIHANANKDRSLYDSATTTPNHIYPSNVSTSSESRFWSSSQRTHTANSPFGSPSSSPLTAVSSFIGSPTDAGSSSVAATTRQKHIDDTVLQHSNEPSVYQPQSQNSLGSKFACNTLINDNIAVASLSNVSPNSLTPTPLNTTSTASTTGMTYAKLPSTSRDDWLTNNLHNVALHNSSREASLNANANATVNANAGTNVLGLGHYSSSTYDDVAPRLPLYSASSSSYATREPSVRSYDTPEIVLRSTNGDRALDIHYPRNPSGEVLMYALSDPHAPPSHRFSPATQHYLQHYGGGYGQQHAGMQDAQGVPLPPSKSARLPGALPYTPPSLECYVNLSDKSLAPKRQDDKLRFPGDLYTPRWVRGEGVQRDGWCSLCETGCWLHLKTSQYLYHVRSMHGVNSNTGRIYDPPLQLRIYDNTFGSTYGLCGECGDWVPICTPRRKRSFTAWFKDAHQCHRLQHRTWTGVGSGGWNSTLYFGHAKPDVGAGGTLMLPPPLSSASTFGQSFSSSSSSGMVGSLGSIIGHDYQQHQSLSSPTSSDYQSSASLLAPPSDSNVSMTGRSAVSLSQRYSLASTPSTLAPSSSNGGMCNGAAAYAINGSGTPTSFYPTSSTTATTTKAPQSTSFNEETYSAPHHNNPAATVYSHRRGASDGYLNSTQSF